MTMRATTAAASALLCLGMAACGDAGGENPDPENRTQTVGQSGASLGDQNPDPGEQAALTDTLPLPPGTVLNGQHALILKGQNAGPSTPPLACSPLPRWERIPPTG